MVSPSMNEADFDGALTTQDAHIKFLLELFNRLECYPKFWIPFTGLE
jgi:hypothetical protein